MRKHDVPSDEMSTADREAGEDLLVALGNTDIVAEGWRPDGLGVFGGGVVGGDGAGESLCVRYLNRHVPHAWIISYYFVVDLRERLCDEEDAKRPFMITEMVECYLADRCPTDVDAEELWSDYTYNDHYDDDIGYATEQAALAVRDRLAAADDHTHYRWDGTRNR